jgi:hypothetical protein
MNPQNRTYTLNGGKVYAGRLTPGGSGGGSPGASGVGVLVTAPGTGGDILSIRPAHGYLKSVHANDLAALNPCPGDACWYSEASKQNGPWANWCGAVYAADYSQYGAMVYWGGGHGGYDGTEFYIFDFTTQKWSRLNNPVSYDFLPDTGADWCDAVIEGYPVAPASHTYGGPVYQASAYGGGNKGSWVLPYNVYGGGAGSGNGTVGYRPHAVDLETGAWRRLTDTTRQAYYPSAVQGSCFVDKHGMLWGIQGSSSDTHVKIDLAAPGAVKTLTNYDGHFYTPGYYWSFGYVPARDFLVMAYLNYSGTTVSLAIYDLAITSGAMDVNPPVTGAPDFLPAPGSGTLNASGFGFDYCPDNNKFYAYEGFGSQIVHVLTPPASGSWKTGTWVWTTETMLGETAVGLIGQGTQAFTKWKYIPALQCFAWSQGTQIRNSPDGTPRAGALQLYRPVGT